MSVWVWVVLVVLIAANALYVAAEFSAVGVRRSRVRRLADDGHWLAKRLLPHIESPVSLDRYVGASQLGITFSSLAAGAYSQAMLTARLSPFIERALDVTDLTALSMAAAVVLAGLTAAQLVLGELVPKALALQYPTQIATATVLPMAWSLVVFQPLIALLNGAALLLLRALGAPERSHRHLHSPEEIDLLIAESRDGGLLEPEEQQRLRRALQLGTRCVADLMVPNARVTMLDVTAPWSSVLETVLASPFSRLPVFKGSRDQVVGTLRVKDLVDRFASEGPVPLDRLMRPILHLIEDMPADRALALLRERRAHTAMVVNTAGLTTGLITVQDLLTELLGPAETAPARPAGATS